MLLRNTVSFAVVFRALKIIPLVISLLTMSGFAVAGNAVRAGFDTTKLPATDDRSSGLENIGFPVNFYGTTYADGLYVNNNGNVTFGQEFTDHNGEVLLNTRRVIIAPFLADVDTRRGNTVTYGDGIVNGRLAYGVNWGDVGCYSKNISVLNNFQVILIDRSDIDTGDFDIEFNYNQIQWDTGPSEGGQVETCTNASLTDRTSARIGFSNGNNGPGQEAKAYEFAGSGVPNYFLDTNLDTGLIHGSGNSDLLGRYLFSVRNGVVIVTDGPVANAGADQTVEFAANGVQVALDGTASPDPAGNLSYSWSGSFLGGTATGPNPVVTFESLGLYTVALTVTDTQSATNDDTVIINVVDTTAPLLTLPADINIECAGAGLPITDTRIQAFLTSATASDAADANPTIINDAPVFCELGDSVVTFTATDVSGNSSQGTAIIRLLDSGKPIIAAALVPVGQGECEKDDDDDDDDDDYKSDSRRGNYASYQRSSKRHGYGKYKRGKKNAKRNRNNKDDDDDCDDDDKKSYRSSSKHGDDEDCDDEEGRFRVEFSCTDSCSATGSGTALLNGIPVKNGQIVELERDDDNEAEYDDGILSIEAPSFRLEVTCGDASDNMSKLVVRPQFQCRDDD